MSSDLLVKDLASNVYPGRGVGWVNTLQDGLVGFYFATGRSAESRARSLTVTGDETLEMIATKFSHDPLRHYPAARGAGKWVVVGNGDHVDEVLERIQAGASPVEAFLPVGYEPDPPLCTARITTVVHRDETSRLFFSSARKPAGERTAADVSSLLVQELAAGEAVWTTTYRSDGTTFGPTPEPVLATTAATTRDEVLDTVWESLDPKYRVAVAAYDPLRPLSHAALRCENA
ncbi:IMP cyclohydrolase [Streptomyces sp. NPDC021020]|uniref:IMP cyclohydrolase n=1 Tax=Streptomyces sp. NPDC021020 TaxID=3365109 RepID=UPI0037A5C895